LTGIECIEDPRFDAVGVSDADERSAFEALIGRTLQGRYRVDALLGVGGMGGVFKAHHLGLGQDVAIKVLRPSMRAGTIAPARFEREARSASRLDHPSCVRVNDFGELEDGTKFLVMELLSGEELKNRLGVAWDPARAIDVALQILSGLAHAHARGVVHRDLKPENVLLTVDHRGQLLVKLVDFGIAKLLEGDEADPKLTRTGMLFGTPRYMSPEQAGGGKVDARTDLYAVGLLLYEMLCGRPPFVATDVASIMRMHVLVPPPALPPGVPNALAAVVMKLLAKSPADRFASAEETIAALEPIRSDTAPMLSVLPHDRVVLASSSSRRFTARQLLVGAVVLAIAWLGVVVVAIAWPRAEATPEVAPPPAKAPAAVAKPPAPVASPPSAAAASSCEACSCEDRPSCELDCADDCDIECAGSQTCRVGCGADCKIECGGHAECTLEVGRGSAVECAGNSHCVVACTADCTVECKGRAQCELRCVDERGSPPSSCGKDSKSCGPCR
jgi:hypothetical protein